jgi:predicted aspartyl protease
MPTSFPYSRKYAPPAPVANVILRAKSEFNTVALLDSGADGTMIPHPLLLRIGSKFARTYQMTGVTGQTERVELYFVDIEIDGLKIPGIKAVSSQFSNEVILGRDVLNHLIITLNGIESRTEIS